MKTIKHTIDKIAQRIQEITCVSLLMMGLLVLVYLFLGKILLKCGLSIHLGEIFPIIYKYLALALFVVFFLLVILRAGLSLFLKETPDEEPVSDKEENATAIAKEACADYSPLRGLNKKQEALVKEMLRQLPAHTRDFRSVNMAAVAQYLTALHQLGLMDIQDKHRLRQWVEQITLKSCPSASAFNEALSTANKQKVRKAKDAIEETLRKT